MFESNWVYNSSSVLLIMWLSCVSIGCSLSLSLALRCQTQRTIRWKQSLWKANRKKQVGPKGGAVQAKWAWLSCQGVARRRSCSQCSSVWAWCSHSPSSCPVLSDHSTCPPGTWLYLLQVTHTHTHRGHSDLNSKWLSAHLWLELISGPEKF